MDVFQGQHLGQRVIAQVTGGEKDKTLHQSYTRRERVQVTGNEREHFTRWMDGQTERERETLTDRQRQYILYRDAPI